MFTHVMVGANNIAASKKFYDAVLGAIGVPEGKSDPKGASSIAPNWRVWHHQAHRRQCRDARQRRHDRLRVRQR